MSTAALRLKGVNIANKIDHVHPGLLRIDDDTCILSVVYVQKLWTSQNHNRTFLLFEQMNFNDNDFCEEKMTEDILCNTWKAGFR